MPHGVMGNTRTSDLGGADTVAGGGGKISSIVSRFVMLIYKINCLNPWASAFIQISTHRILMKLQ